MHVKLNILWTLYIYYVNTCKYNTYKARICLCVRVRLFDGMSFYVFHGISTHHLQHKFQSAITCNNYSMQTDAFFPEIPHDSRLCQVSLGFLSATKLSLLLLQASDLALKFLPLPKKLQFSLLSFAGSCHLGVQQTRLARCQFLRAQSDKSDKSMLRAQAAWKKSAVTFFAPTIPNEWVPDMDDMNNQSAVCPKKSPTTKLWLGCSDGDIFLLGLRLFLLQLRLEFLQFHPKFLFCSNLHLLPRPTESGANGAQELKSEPDSSPGIWDIWGTSTYVSQHSWCNPPPHPPPPPWAKVPSAALFHAKRCSKCFGSDSSAPSLPPTSWDKSDQICFWKLKVIHGSLNVPIEHHPTIRFH